MMRSAAILLVAALVATPATAETASFNPASVSIEDALACRMDARHYNALVVWLTGPDNGAAKRKWTRVRGDDPSLVEYRLPAPVRAFNRTTDRIGFAGTAVLALLPGVPAKTIAEEADIPNKSPSADSFVGEKIVDRQVERDADQGLDITYKRLQIVLVLKRHPGMTFAGCSYRTEEGHR